MTRRRYDLVIGLLGPPMKKVLGIFGLLLIVCVLASIGNPDFLGGYNLQQLLKRAALYGFLGLGAAFVIMAGGIDLSTGSMVGLVGCLFPMLVMQAGVHSALAWIVILLGVACLGLIHGLLITKVKLQPFIVTLCGLLIYRGVARWITNDQNPPGLPLAERELVFAVIELPFGEYKIPVLFPLLVGVAIVAAVFLNLTIYGRYLLAVGRNEQAARYSGINTERITIFAYVLSAVLGGGLGGILFILELVSIQPDAHGSFYELYGIAAAVLGGCSLRGGEGSILGVVLGAALIPVLTNASSLVGFPTQLEFLIIGVVILAGAITDEMVKRVAAARQRRRAG
jgi:ribose transport system permease protein